MPSFLTKVFGRKKDEKDAASASNSSLIGGKYEAVSPPSSPSAVQSSGQQSTQQTHVKESSLPLFRSRSRTVDKQQPSSLTSASAPHLTLNLPVPKEEKSRALGVVFEADPESNSALPDETIGDRRLSPLEALVLVKACSSAIADRGGLESLGLMHPHWHSASPEVQRKLVSLFILSLGTNTPITTLSPTPTSPSAIFETELSYTRDPHDIASVLRWGVRHLRLEGSSLGKGSSSSEWSWYQTFASSERDANYPPRAFSQSLVPLLPPAHLQLLTALLDIMSSLAAHGEAIGTSGSKLSKLFGLWLVSAERAKASENWAEFYKRWEQAGRIFEHLFLAYIREEDSGHKMPLRLSELVKQYPYHSEKASGNANDGLPLLPIPRFSTRRRDALFIRVDTLLPTPSSPRPSREHPLRLISEAFKVSVASDATIVDAANAIWQDLKAKASADGESDGAYPALSKILDDETMRLLSMIPADQSSPLASPVPRSATTSSPATPLLRAPESPARTRSASVGNPNGDSKANGHNGTAPSLTNWADFSTTGFGDSSIGQSLSLSITESDKTSPSQTSSRRPSPPRGRSTTLDTHTRKPTPPAASNPETKPKSTVKSIEIVQVDEAFFDFWSDSLLDPISADWPSFVVCQLKDSPSKTPLLVIEQTISRPSPPPMPPMPSLRETSPRPSISASVGGRKSFTFSPTIKRFSFFNTQNRAEPMAGGAKKTSVKSATKSPRIGELGEILPEEEPVAAPTQPAKPTPAKPVAGLGLTTAEPKPSTASPKVEAALPAVPLVEAAAPEVPAEVAPVATEAVKTESEAPEKPTAAVPENPADVAVPVDDLSPSADSETTEKALPPAPEPVILAGGTPGPEVALSSSEPAAIAHAAETALAEDVAATEPEHAAPEQEQEPERTESSAEDQTLEESTLEEEPHQPSGGAVVSAFTEHLDSSDEIPPPKPEASLPEPTIEEEIAAEVGAESSEPVTEHAAELVTEPVTEPVSEAAVAAAEPVGASTEHTGGPIESVAESVTHDTVPELETKDDKAANGNGSSHVAEPSSQAADDTQDPHPNPVEEASA